MRIAVVAPSGPPTQARVAAGLAVLEAAGHQVTLHGSIGADNAMSYLNDNDDARGEALLAALHSEADVVWCARGGYGLHRLLPRLLDNMPESMPMVVGFSDVTALFGAAAVRGQLHRCVHGPLITTLADEPPESQQRMWGVLQGSPQPQPQPLSLLSGGSFVAEGPLFAGNLTVLAALVGTVAMPNLEGHVVVIEEVGEAPYRIDRMMTQLTLAGAWSGVQAIVAGQLTRCDLATGTTALAVLQERAENAGVHFAWGLAAGHETPNAALPLGAAVRLQVVDGQGSLSWL